MGCLYLQVWSPSQHASHCIAAHGTQRTARSAWHARQTQKDWIVTHHFHLSSLSLLTLVPPAASNFPCSFICTTIHHSEWGRMHKHSCLMSYNLRMPPTPLLCTLSPILPSLVVLTYSFVHLHFLFFSLCYLFLIVLSVHECLRRAYHFCHSDHASRSYHVLHLPYFLVCPALTLFLYILYILILPLFFFFFFVYFLCCLFFFFILFISGEPWTHLDTILLNTTSRLDPSSAVRHTSSSWPTSLSLSPYDGLNKLEPKYRIILRKRV